VLSQSDLIVVLGSELAEVDIWRYNLGHECTLVRVDTDPEVLSDHHKADIKLNMKVKDFVNASIEHFDGQDSKGKWDPKFVSKKRKEWILQATQEFPGVSKVIHAVEEIIPQNTVIYSDMTQFAYLAKEIWDMKKPNHWHHPYGFGTLGYALPAAIGGCVARPEMPTIAIAGDYGFQYTMQELGTAVELQLSLPILIWDNQKLKAIEDSMIAAQIAPNSVKALNPDFCKLADSYGAQSRKPASLQELQNDITEAFKAAIPTVIHITEITN
jgi:acetolactate synthase-1/2/3 large subunit/5-guanidino-2-oxopentanoate decarboxylase